MSSKLGPQPEPPDMPMFLRIIVLLFQLIMSFLSMETDG